MIERLKNYNTNQILILLTSLAMFMPFYIGFGILGFDLFYFIYTNQMGDISKEMKNSKYLFFFIFYAIVVSVANQNSYGLMASFGILIFCLFFLFYRVHLTKDLFKDVIRVMIIATGITFCVTLLKYGLVFVENHMDLAALANYYAENRDVSNYFNANYYAMICELMIVLTSYLANIATKRSRKLLYVVITAVAFGALILTGSRSALAIAILIVVLMNYNFRKKKTRVGMIEIGMILFIAVNIIGETGLFPRFVGMDESFGLREKIWRATVGVIQEHWLFGVGPMGLYSEVHMLGSRAVHHSHNIILDFIINFGFVGFLILLPFVNQIIQEIRNAKRTPYFPIILMMTGVILLHGMVDVTIFWHQTAFIYFVFVSGVGKLYSEPVKVTLPVLAREKIPSLKVDQPIFYNLTRKTKKY